MPIQLKVGSAHGIDTWEANLNFWFRVPIIVHMLDKKTNSLKVIAEYGQEYGKENPVRVLYHGYGHYDILKNQFGNLQLKR